MVSSVRKMAIVEIEVINSPVTSIDHNISQLFFTAKSTELLPNSQEGSKKIQSVHSSANVVQQSGGPAGFGEEETDNLPGLFILCSEMFLSICDFWNLFFVIFFAM